MNKQEAIDKINNMGTLKIRDTTLHQQFDTVDKNKVLDIISKIHEPQKVVVPQFVADWLEVCKENLGFGLSTAMSHSTSAMKKQPNWVKGWFNLKDNQETFAKAWLYGYEIEKEKLYTVEIPNPNGDGYGRVYLGRNEDNKIELRIWDHFSSIEFSNDWKQFDNAQLTEDEIKKDYKWAWQFAKEVE